MIEYSAQIADRTKLFRSRIREIVGGRTETLEALAVEMYWRGLSIRDIELLFADEAKALLSRTALIRGAASESPNSKAVSRGNSRQTPLRLCPSRASNRRANHRIPEKSRRSDCKSWYSGSIPLPSSISGDLD